METDTESNLQEYQIQLEQVELALKSDPSNDELLKLKADLVEVIGLTKELLNEENEARESRKGTEITWKSGDKCMAVWRVDGKYYSATVDQVLEDGTCTVIFDGYTTNEITQVGQLKPRGKNANILANHKTQTGAGIASGSKKSFTKKELELKIREAKKRKREKYALKVKAMEEISERDKNKWKSFNTKLASKTWKGVVKKNKFDLPEYHENKTGVGANSITNRIITPSGTILPGTSNSSASASAAALQSNGAAKTTRHTSQSYKTTMY